MAVIDLENKDGNEVKGDIFAPSLTIYQKEIGKYGTLSREEECELVLRAQNGDTDARNRIIEANLKFVHKVAMWFTSYGVDMGDLISEGNLGITKAIDKFDVNRGIKFYSYAVWWIRQSIVEFIEKYKGCQSVDIPENLGFDDTLDDDERDMMKSSVETDSAYDDAQCFCETTDKERDDKLVGRLMGVLTETERKVIDMTYGMEDDEKTLKEIGKELGVSMERVRQIRIKAIRKMKSEYLMGDDE